MQAYKSPKIEFMVGQTIWMEAETPFMDIVLPACTHYESTDISEWASTDFNVWRTNHRVIVYHQKCIDPLYESKTDMDIFTMLADKLGFKEQLTEGNTVEDWIRKTFEASDIKKYMTYEEFKKKGYFVAPIPDDHEPRTAFRSFYETGTGLDTPSGKIEFESQRIMKYLPDDRERAPVPHYVPSWEGPYHHSAGQQVPFAAHDLRTRGSHTTVTENSTHGSAISGCTARMQRRIPLPASSDASR